MSNWEDGLKADMLKMLQRNEYLGNIVEVISWEEVQSSGVFCDTCDYNFTEVEIFYKTAEGIEVVYNYSGTLSKLLNYLVAND